MIIKELKDNEIKDANDLAFKVFLKYEAPDYDVQGINEFKNSIYSKEFIEKHSYYGAYEENNLLGMIATRNNNGHIAMFFVDEDMQSKGIGKKLFNEICKDNINTYISANSSPYALAIYLHLGFKKSNDEQCINGIKFIPIRYKL